MLITGGLIAFAVLALVAAFLVARGEKKSAKSTKSVQAVQVQPEQPTISPNSPAIDEQATEKRAAISALPRQQLAARSQTSEPLGQLDFPEHSIPTYININRGTTVSDFDAHAGTSLSERWTLEPTLYSEREIPLLKRQLYELAGQLHMLQHKSQAIEQRVLEISSILERIDNENAAKSNANGSSAQLSSNG